MEMVIPVTLGRIFATRWASSSHASGWREHLIRSGTSDASRSLLTFFSGLIMTGALLLTGSRAGLLSFLGSMLVIAFLLVTRRVGGKGRWKPLASFVAVGFAVALWLNAGRVLKTFAILWVGTNDLSTQGRLHIWQDTLRLGRDYCWSGTGLNTFAWAFPRYKSLLLEQSLFVYTENDYLQAFAEGGLPLVAVLALALLRGGAQLRNGWSERQRPYERGMGLGLLGGLAAILIHSAGDFNLHITANAILFVLLLGLATRVLVFGCSREPSP